MLELVLGLNEGTHPHENKSSRAHNQEDIFHQVYKYNKTYETQKAFIYKLGGKPPNKGKSALVVLCVSTLTTT